MNQFDNNELSILNYLVCYYIGCERTRLDEDDIDLDKVSHSGIKASSEVNNVFGSKLKSRDSCLLYTSPSPRDGRISRMPSSA